MAPKPNQMQLEKQKNAAIQRTQQAAEQTQNMQQPVQQNAQTQQNAQQFWTEEMALKEQIPMQSENLSEEMKSAYENVHGQKMGVKSRIWRTERTTKKKREKSNALRAADARYAHNRQILEKKYAMEEPLKDVDAPFQSAVKTWMDLSGTESADASNQTMLKRLNGKRDDQNKAITSIKNKIDGWKLQDYQNLDDQQITDRYYDLKDKIEKAKAKAYKVIYEYGISIGKSRSAGYEAKVLAKVEYFIRLEPYIQAKYDLITSPYYSLLRKADLDALSDEQLKQRLDQAGENMQSFYDTVSKLREMRKDARALMADPAAFEEEETKKQLQETTRKAVQAKETGRRLDLKYEIEEYEQELSERREKNRKEMEKNNPKYFQVQETRRKLQAPAQKAIEIANAHIEVNRMVNSRLSEQALKSKDGKRCLGNLMSPGMTEEERIARFEAYGSDDPNMRFAEYDKVFDELLNMDLSRFKIATDEEILENAGENLIILQQYHDLQAYLDHVLKDGMKIPDERLKAIRKLHHFMEDLYDFYWGRVNLLANTEYELLSEDENPEILFKDKKNKEDIVLAVEALSEKMKDEHRKEGKKERTRRIEDLMNRMEDVLIATNVNSIDRTKTVPKLWEEYKKNTERAEEMEQQKKLKDA